MMLTDDAIFAAADAIFSETGKVTQDVVRQRVGGSFNTIGPALKRWKAKKEDSDKAALLAQAPPEAIQVKSSALTAEIWSLAQRTAEERLSQETKALAEKEKSLVKERDDANEVADRLVTENGDLTQTLEDVQKTLAMRDAELRDASLKLEHVTAQVEALEAQLAERTAEKDAATVEAAMAKGEAKAFQGQIDMLKEQNAALLMKLEPMGNGNVTTHKGK